VVDIDPLETCSKAAFDWLDKDAVARLEQTDCLLRRGEQTFAEDNELIIAGNKSGQRAGPGYDMEPHTDTLGLMLQLDQLGYDFARHADHTLTLERQGDAKLVTRQGRTAHTQECTRQDLSGSRGFHHGK
jgi:hypothetical protein